MLQRHKVVWNGVRGGSGDCTLGADAGRPRWAVTGRDSALPDILDERQIRGEVDYFVSNELCFTYGLGLHWLRLSRIYGCITGGARLLVFMILCVSAKAVYLLAYSGRSNGIL